MDGFRLKGWHVFLTLVGFFGAVITANVVFIGYAVRSFPGQDVERSYLQGLHFNDALAEKAREEALGWSARIQTKHDGGRSVFEIALDASDNQPLSGLTLTGELRRPASSKGDRTLAFAEIETGRYRAEAVAIAPGAYDLRAVARSNDGREFKMAKRLVLK